MNFLQQIVDKVSQYNFITNILPGTILCIVLKYYIGYDLMVDDSFVNGFIFYFVGMVNNRIGSLFIEPLCRWTHIVRFSKYSYFVAAEKVDGKLSILSMENNAFRSYISLFFIAIMALIYRDYLSTCTFIYNHQDLILLCILLVIFVLSYRKRTTYIRKRVEVNVKCKTENH